MRANKKLTTNTGCPVAHIQNIMIAGPYGLHCRRGACTRTSMEAL